MKKGLRPGKYIYWFFAVLWLLTTLFPFYFTLISSFKPSNKVFEAFLTPPLNPTLENYRVAVQDTGVLQAIGNSLMVSLMAIALLLLACTLAAYAISRRRVPFSSVLSVVFIAALMIPVQSMIVPIVQMVSALELKNNLLVLSVIYAGINSSMSFFILRNYFDSIPIELDEAAQLDGCNPFQLVFRIIVPVAKPALATCGILAFLNTYNEMAIANVLIQKSELKTLSLALLSLRGDYGAMYSVIFAGVVLSLVPTILFYLFAQEKVEKSIVTGVAKG